MFPIFPSLSVGRILVWHAWSPGFHFQYCIKIGLIIPALKRWSQGHQKFKVTASSRPSLSLWDAFYHHHHHTYLIKAMWMLIYLNRQCVAQCMATRVGCVLSREVSQRTELSGCVEIEDYPKIEWHTGHFRVAKLGRTWCCDSSDPGHVH